MSMMRELLMNEQKTYDPIIVQMKKEMPSLYKKLVLWYNPSRQGITNEYLQTDAPILKDLSGNEHDSSLIGFQGVSGYGHVESDGRLNYGQGCSSMCDSISIYDNYNASMMWSFVDNVREEGTFIKVYNPNITTSNRGITIGITYYQNKYWWLSYGEQANSTLFINNGVFMENMYVTGTTLNGFENVYRPHIEYTYTNIRLVGRNKVLKYLILFDKPIDSTDISWIRNNMISA